MPVFVGPGSAPNGGFEGKSDRVGLNTATADPGSAVVGDMYVKVNGTTADLRLYNGTSWNNVNTGFSASGGNVDGTSADGATYHIFTASGSFVVSSGSKTAEVLMIAGGGGGGNQHGGGGGAGALYFNTSFSLTAGTYPVTIGGGGAGGTSASPDGSTNGGNTIFGPGTPLHVQMNGGGRGRRMATPNVTLEPGGPGGCGGGGGLTPIHPSPPVRQAGGTVTAPPTHSLPSPLVFGNAGGQGNDYNAAPNAGGGGGGGGCNPSTGGPPTNEVPATNGTAAQGGSDFICPTPFLPTSAMSTLAAALGTPTVLLGVPIPSPDNQKRAFGGGGAGGSHSPWGVYNPGGRYPNNQGGGSDNRTGGEGGLGNSDQGYPGVDGRGGGGGGSGAGPASAGDGGDGVIIIRYV